MGLIHGLHTNQKRFIDLLHILEIFKNLMGELAVSKPLFSFFTVELNVLQRKTQTKSIH